MKTPTADDPTCTERGEVFEAVEVLHLGAEAEVTAGRWLGLDAIRKQRRSRSWRHPDLDERLGRQRLLGEARLLLRLHRAGLRVPALYDADVERDVLIMERLHGRPLIDVLRDPSTPDVLAVMRAVGSEVRRLHAHAVTHGDLSTNNILVTPDGNVALIDFGLSTIEYDVERFGIDLHVLDEVLGASHPDRQGAMESLLEGYLASDLAAAQEGSGGTVPSAVDVVERLDVVRTRVRYHG